MSFDLPNKYATVTEIRVKNKLKIIPPIIPNVLNIKGRFKIPAPIIPLTTNSAVKNIEL